MADVTAVVNSAPRLSTRSEVAREILLGMRAKAVATAPQRSGATDFEPKRCIMAADGESCTQWSEAIQARD